MAHSVIIIIIIIQKRPYSKTSRYRLSCSISRVPFHPPAVNIQRWVRRNKRRFQASALRSRICCLEGCQKRRRRHELCKKSNMILLELCFFLGFLLWWVFSSVNKPQLLDPWASAAAVLVVWLFVVVSFFLGLDLRGLLDFDFSFPLTLGSLGCGFNVPDFQLLVFFTLLCLFQLWVFMH
jgi:hypothetical protein